MASKKVYAIKEGFDFKNNKKVENLIVNTWNECLAYVKGAKGAKYKSFESRAEAEAFLNAMPTLIKKEDAKYDQNVLQAYVDGSFDIQTKRYSYGLVLVKNNKIIHIDRGAAKDTKQAALRQIAGELQAAMEAMSFAVNISENKILIFHDYEGISHHATGFWQRKEESSQKYYEFYQQITNDKNLDVTFIKVDSHTGDLYNEIADEQAKIALNMKLPRVADKLIKENKIIVSNDKAYEALKDILSKDALNNVKIETNDKKKIDKETKKEESVDKVNKIKELLKINLSEAEQYMNTLSDEDKNNIIINLLK